MLFDAEAIATAEGMQIYDKHTKKVRYEFEEKKKSFTYLKSRRWRSVSLHLIVSLE